MFKKQVLVCNICKMFCNNKPLMISYVLCSLDTSRSIVGVRVQVTASTRSLNRELKGRPPEHGSTSRSLKVCRK